MRNIIAGFSPKLFCWAWSLCSFPGVFLCERSISFIGDSSLAHMSILTLTLTLILKLVAKEKVHPKRWQEQQPKAIDLLFGLSEAVKPADIGAWLSIFGLYEAFQVASILRMFWARRRCSFSNLQGMLWMPEQDSPSAVRTTIHVISHAGRPSPAYTVEWMNEPMNQ